MAEYAYALIASANRVFSGGRPKPRTARRRFENVDMVEEKYLKSKGHREKWRVCLPEILAKCVLSALNTAVDG